MDNEFLILSPEEIFYLGTLFQAKYIDYSYVTLMEDIQKGKAVFESKAKDGLMEKGVLEEDFGGEIVIMDKWKGVLEPLYFGEFESSLQFLLNAEGGPRSITKRFHFYKGAITMTTGIAEGFLIQGTDMDGIREWLKTVFHWDTKGEQVKFPTAEIKKERISSILIVKSYRLGAEFRVETMVEYEGRMLRETENGMAESISCAELCGAICDLIKEA